MTDDKICRNDGRCEYAIQAGVEGLAQCQAGKCSMPKPAAHLTIPGALEWDGDNGTHGADGESRAHGESEKAMKPVGQWYEGEPPHPWRCEWFIAQTIHGDKVVLRSLPEEHTYDYKTADETYMVAKNIKLWMQFPDSEFLPYTLSGDEEIEVVREAIQKAWRESDEKFIRERDDLRAQLANTEQSRRSFFDLSQDLEKRLAERDALLSKATAFVQNLCAAAGSQPSVATGYLRDILDVLSASAEPIAPTEQVFTFDLEHFATKERRTVTLTKAEVADGMEDTLYEKLGEQICQCQSVGETNVVDCNCDEYIHDFELVSSMASAEPTKPEPSREWTDAELTELFSPGSGNKAKRRIAAIEQAKQKTCIECDQPHCHGVCVERGDQDYDRDQAAKGGGDE